MVQIGSGEEILRGCDESQYAAITSPARTLLVIAGAGAGKTRVLTRRIAWRIAIGDAAPPFCLALTFTRRAASELRERLGSLGLPSPVHAGTFHAIALAQLRQRAIDRGRPLPVLVERKSQLLGAILPPWSNRRLSKAPLERRDLLASVAAEIEWAKARLVRPEHYLVEATRYSRTPAIDLEAVAEGYALYETERKRRRLYDFDDLLTTVAELINRDADFAAAQRWKFQHLFVDEFQDANAAQIQLLEAWCGSTRDLFCVGDARQAIYGWNGADPGAIENFKMRYQGGVVLELSTNYRSSAALVRFSQAALPTSTQTQNAAREEGPVPTIHAYASDTDEAIGIAEGIRALYRKNGTFGNCAVLARTNAQLPLIAHALSTIGIPTRRNDADEFLTHPGVRRALELLHGDLDRRRSSAQVFRSWLGDLSLEIDEQVPEDLSAGELGEMVDRAPRELANLEALVLIAREYQELEPLPSADGFQAYLERTLAEEILPATAMAVDLLSFHRAKGLEWPIVFVIGLEEGFVPVSYAKNRAMLAEEKRLLYVALSRAGEELHCSWARQRTFGKKRLSREPSPFLASIGEVQRRLLFEQHVDPALAHLAIAQSRSILRTRPPES
ncbi:MAG TPA: ATP-dependent helicase [Acidimicrobiales bacterium]|nr:ATP-dependent helicase [Acidimicrobiales bacterium]